MDDTTAPSPLKPGHAPAALPPGTVIDGRFRIEALGGRGGMGSVYRAIDSLDGRRVALKLLHVASSPEVAYRFGREAVLLSELRHPAIVSYVAHGVTQEGQPFLCMEWLEGEDLARRLGRERLTLSETLALLRRAAEGLDRAHRQGIIHRDLKPSNLFLRAGRAEEATLLDFGLARYARSTLVSVTGSRTVVGTPDYMAPEQASSQHDISPSADIFSLGCVLYECLTGQPPFRASHFAAVLAKILFAEPPPIHTLRAGLPHGLQVLVDRMLAKDPRRRLPDAASLLEALSALESVPELLLPPAVEELALPSLADAEQQLVSVLLVSQPCQEAGQGLELRDSLRTLLAPYGAQQAELLVDGSLVATLAPERGTVTDQVALAARCALSFKERWPDITVVLVTGLGVINEQLPVGEAMDRAGRLLRQFEQSSDASSFVVLDEISAGLLGSGFQVSRPSSDTFLLLGEQLGIDESRPLMGKPTPCVGREQELALLEFTFSSCVEEPSSRALLVTAPAGMGKSRLRHEFLRRIERKSPRPLVLLGRGDPMSTGVGLLGQALRRLFVLGEGEAPEVRWERLYQRVVRYLPEARAQETAEFLGELCAIPFPEEGSPRLHAARGDPRLMNAQVGRALVAFLEAECAHHPVLLVLEDLHWSDALTVKLVDELLRELAEQPLIVLALARPEVKELFPGLWSRRMQEVTLHGLSRKASTRLVREVLGARVPDPVIQRTVEQADGNALFLEELIRRVVEGRAETPPETVLAVLQARLTRMEQGARQTLLAASIFGRTFWAEGVGALLRGQEVGGPLEQHLRQLVEQEVIEPQPDSRFPAEGEYRFRHALVRDAAYGLVPDSLRPAGHRLAGIWLEQMGEPDALVLATHYRLGQQPERAVHFYLQAAERLLEWHELSALNRCVDEALSCGVDGKALAPLRALQATAAFWMDEFDKSYEVGRTALPELSAGSSSWCRLMGGLIAGAAHSGRLAYAAELARFLLRVHPEPDALTAYIEAVSFLANTTTWSGASGDASTYLARMSEVSAGGCDAMARGWMCCSHGFFEYFFEARPWNAFVWADQGTKVFQDIGATVSPLATQALAGLALAALGDQPGALERLRESLRIAQQDERHRYSIGYARMHLALVLGDGSEEAWRDEAQALLLEHTTDETRSLLYKGVTSLVLAKVAAGRHQWAEAEAQARRACEMLAPFLPYLLFARTALASVLLAQGRGAESRQQATLGVEELERMGSEGVSAVPVYLALAEACFVQDDRGAGEEALRNALRCVRNRASDIPDAAVRERFLCQVPENARTLEWARQCWGGNAPVG